MLDTTNEITETLSQKRNMIFELLNAGLLTDENGKMSSSTKQKVLEMIGFGVWQDGNDMLELHRKKAGKENVEMLSQNKVKLLEVDDNEVHIKEHTAFLLSLNETELGDRYDAVAELILKHIDEHKHKISVA